MTLIDLKLEKLKALRKDLFELQNKYIDLLCNDSVLPESDLEKAFGSLLWQLDNETRRLKKG